MAASHEPGGRPIEHTTIVSPQQTAVPDRAGHGRAPSIRIRTAALSAVLGTMLEWYDFGLYGWSSALIFSQLFFVSSNPTVSALGAFGSFAIGFLARPLGSVLFGHVGDRAGRKLMLIVTIVMMGVATMGIGALPTYQTIGVWAPVLLTVLRILQGVALGGEFGGSTLITAEHAAPRHRGFWASSTAAGAPAGLLLSAGVFYVFSTLPEHQFLSWGWRIPFLLSVAVLAAGLLVRAKVPETPHFTRATEDEATAAVPIVELMKRHKSIILRAAGARLVDAGAANVFTVFAVSYIVSRTSAGSQLALGANAVANTFHLLLIPVAAAVSDRLGRRRLIALGAIVMAALAAPGFLLIDTGSTVLVIAGIVVAWTLPSTMQVGPTPAMLSELFPTRIRASGTSLVYQLQTLVAGVTPFVATALLALGGNRPWLIVAYIVVLGVITTLCAFSLPERTGRDLSDDDAQTRIGASCP